MERSRNRYDFDGKYRIRNILITGAGLYELSSPPVHPVVHAELHAQIWWGGLLLVLGVFYSVKFRPGRG